MQVNTIRYIESLPGYSRDLDALIDAATLMGIGHERYNSSYTPSAEQINACIASLDGLANDPFDATLALFFTDKTEAELRADRSRQIDQVRALLNRLERDITIGGAK